MDSEAVLGMFMTMSVCVAERVLSTEMTAMSKHKSLPIVNWSLLCQFPQLGPPPTLASRRYVHLHSTEKQTEGQQTVEEVEGVVFSPGTQPPQPVTDSPGSGLY